MKKSRIEYSKCPRLIFIERVGFLYRTDVRKGCGAPWTESTDSVHWSATLKGAIAKANANNTRGQGNDYFHKHPTDSNRSSTSG